MLLSANHRPIQKPARPISAEKHKPRGGEIKLSGRKFCSKTFEGPAEGTFKSHFGQYRPGSISQEETKKELSARKAGIWIFWATAQGRSKSASRPISAEKHQPRGGKKCGPWADGSNVVSGGLVWRTHLGQQGGPNRPQLLGFVGG